MLLSKSNARRVVLVFVTVFLRSHKSLESVDPQFTMRRKMEQLREELELMEQLRDVRHTSCTLNKSLVCVINKISVGF